MKRSTVVFECHVSMTIEEDTFTQCQIENLRHLLLHRLRDSVETKDNWKIDSVKAARLLEKIETVTEL